MVGFAAGSFLWVWLPGYEAEVKLNFRKNCTESLFLNGKGYTSQTLHFALDVSKKAYPFLMMVRLSPEVMHVDSSI